MRAPLPEVSSIGRTFATLATNTGEAFVDNPSRAGAKRGSAAVIAADVIIMEHRRRRLRRCRLRNRCRCSNRHSVSLNTAPESPIARKCCSGRSTSRRLLLLGTPKSRRGMGGLFSCYSSAVLPVGLILSRAMGQAPDNKRKWLAMQ